MLESAIPALACGCGVGAAAHHIYHPLCNEYHSTQILGESSEAPARDLTPKLCVAAHLLGC